MQHTNARSLHTLFNMAGLKAAGAGALGAFAGSVVASTLLAPFFDFGLQSRSGFGTMLLGQSLLGMFSGMILSAIILAYDNQAGLRGRWSRDLWRGLPLFALIGLLSGGAGQLLYSIIGITRGLPWGLMGGGIGAGIGLLRRDKVQTQRGALGGALGGLIGGLLVDAALAFSYTDAAFSTASQVGLIITGALIALLMRVVQDALKNAWLLGISTGPYEGREYSLNTARISVGRSELNDIALFREEAIPPQLGALVFHHDAWRWQGTPVMINSAFSADAPLQPGDTIQLGATNFRFQTRSLKTSASNISAPPVPNAPSVAGAPSPAPTSSSFPMAMPQPATPPIPRDFSPPPSAAAMPAASAPPPTISDAMLPAAPLTVSGATWILQSATGAPLRLPPAPAQVQLGRGAQNEVVLNDAGVSSVHARFNINASTLTITDLSSTNGTFVNGQRLAANVPTALHSGDKITFGRLEYVVQNG